MADEHGTITAPVEDAEQCENCDKPATTHDPDGVPLCATCDHELIVEAIAQVCYAANRAYAETYAGDICAEPWETCSPELRRSIQHGVEHVLSHPNLPARQQHDAWMCYKLEHGWTLGDVKDEAKKTHPGLVPWDDLDDYEQRKDVLFLAIVRTLSQPVE